MIGFCKCHSCGKIDMNNIVYYSERDLTPMQLCNSCLCEFEFSMASVFACYNVSWGEAE